MNPDLFVYAAHAAFWLAFGVARSFASRSAPGDAAAAAPTAKEEVTAPGSRALLVLHMVGFGVLYFGLGNAVFPRRVPEWFPGQRLAGALLIALGAALCCWAVLSFRSWRFRAKLDAGHQLATGGPFGIVRHPIYAALDLLALGTAIWVPTAIVWIGAALMLIAADLRARSEEALLLQAFGATYADYRARTARFLPGVY
jgi:protein-S-isoprenylcysteine O-methyltransferase Ste14